MNTDHLLPMAQKAAHIHWQKLRAQHKNLGPNIPVIKLNNRFKATAGKCYIEERIIDLSTELFYYHAEHFVKVIIPHELIHQVDYDLNGRSKQWHGPKWKSLMVQYGLPPDTYHSLKNPLRSRK